MFKSARSHRVAQLGLVRRVFELERILLRLQRADPVVIHLRRPTGGKNTSASAAAGEYELESGSQLTSLIRRAMTVVWLPIVHPQVPAIELGPMT